MKTLTEQFKQLFEAYMSDPEADDRYLQEVLVQAVKERDAYVLEQASKGHEPIEEIMKETL